MCDRRGERSRRLRWRCAATDNTRTDGHGQLSLAVVEAVVATLFILAVVVGLALASPALTTEPDALARQATDAALLAGSAPVEGSGALLGAACGSPAKLDDRTARLHGAAAAGLPNSAFVSLRTEVGSTGRPSPETVRAGVTTAVIPRCTATLEVWYP